MKLRLTHHLIAALLGVALTTTLHAQTSAFTYQGQLSENGSPANGFYDLTFSIWTNSSGPSQVGPTLAAGAVPVSDGLFSVTLDFGAGVFDGNDRWLEIGVATNGSGVFTNLSPRQQVSSTPYAIKAAGVDASNLTGTLLLTQLPATVVTNEASDISLSGSFSGDAGGLTNLDSSRLTGPLTVLGGGLLNIGQIDDGGQARSVAVAGHYAYLANYDDGLRIYDISDPTTPLSIGHTNNGSFSRGIAVSGDYAYLANWSDGLRVYDVSDPTTPINIGHTNDGGSAWSVVVSGDYAYLADTADGLQIFDVSDPSNPMLVGTTNTGGFGRDVAVSGDYAYLAGHSGGLHVYDISDPTTPVEVGATNNTEGIALGVAVSGNYVYLANGTDGLRVYDVSNPANPENIGHIAAGGSAESVVVADGYAYMAENSFLRAYDVRDPANPVEVGVFKTVFCLDVAVDGNYLYLANGFDGLYVFDVTVARATSFSGHFLGDGRGLTNLHLNSLEAADGNPAQAVYVDNVGNVGIGTTAPGDLLHIYGGTGGSADIRARMIIEDDDTAYLQFVTPSTTEKGLLFGDEANGDRAGLIFNNASTPQGLQFRTGNNTTRMVLTSAGDVGIGTANPTNKLDVVGDVSATTFITTSDRNMKENVRPVVPEEVLAKVAALPLYRWNFKADADTTHLGSMAQDFYAAFRVGPDDKHIATVDADGVALAAIQGLNQKLEQKAAEITELKTRLEKLEQLMENRLAGGGK